MKFRRIVIRGAALALVIPFALGAAAQAREAPMPDEQAPNPQTTGSETAAPAETAPPPATIDTNGDGKADAWDRDGNGTPDAWDTNADGIPDAVDDNGDGKPDVASPR